MITNNTEAKYLAKTICKSDNGCVNKISRVPLFDSSANIFIVTAGIKNKNTQGAMTKRVSIEA